MLKFLPKLIARLMTYVVMTRQLMIITHNTSLPVTELLYQRLQQLILLNQPNDVAHDGSKLKKKTF